MRILVITETWRPGVDGVVTRLEHTVAELGARGHQVRVLAPTIDPRLDAVDQVRTAGVVIPFVDRHRRWGLPQPGLPAMVRDFAPTVVHVVNPVMFGSAAVRALADRHPLVASLHTDLAAYAAHYRLQFTRPLLRMINRATYSRADVALATSDFGAQLLDDLGVGSVGLWSAGVAAPFFEAGVRRWRRADRIDPSERSAPLDLLGVGRLAPEKGWDALAPLLRSGRVAGRELRLTLVGDGPDRRRLEHVFAATPTRFLGTLHGERLVEAYADADLLVSASTTETVGLTLLEAAATGLPVVAVDGPQVRATVAGRTRLGLVGESVRTDPDAWAAAIDSVTVPAPAPVPAVPIPSWSAATDQLLDHYAAAVSRSRLGRPAVPQASP